MAAAPAGSQSTLARGAAWLVAVFPAAAMWAIDPAGYQPFGPAKYLVTSVLLLLAATCVIAGGRRLVGHRPVLWVGGGLLAWWVVAAIAGVDRFHAWVGLPERRLGVIAWILFAAAYLLGGSFDGAARHRIVRGGVVALAGLSVWAMLQGFGIAPFDLTTSSVRLGSLFGSAAFLAAACTLLIPLSAGVALDATTSTLWRVAGTAAAVLGTAALAGSGTRAGWVGLLVAGLVVAVVRRRAVLGRMTMVGAIVGIGVVAFVAGGWLLPEAERPQDAVGRDAGSARLDEWTVAARSIADRPILGAGPEGYRIVAGRNIDESYERAHGRRVLPDRAHNGFLDVGAAGGVPAMALYGVLLWLVGRRVWRVLRGGPAWLAGAAAGLIGYAAQQQFLFPLAEVDPVAWLLVGVVTTGVAAAERSHEPGAPADPTTVAMRLPRAVAVVPSLLAACALWFGGRELVADRHTREVVRALDRGQPDRAVEEAIDAVRLRPDVLRNRIALSRALRSGGTPEAVRAAVQVLDEALDWSPRDPILRRERAALLTTLATSERSPAAAATAREAWEEVGADDPNNGSVWNELGLARVLTGDHAAAEAAWRHAAELTPRGSAALLNLAKLYFGDQRLDDARAAVDEAERRTPGDPDVAKARAAVSG